MMTLKRVMELMNKAQILITMKENHPKMIFSGRDTINFVLIACSLVYD